MSLNLVKRLGSNISNTKLKATLLLSSLTLLAFSGCTALGTAGLMSPYASPKEKIIAGMLYDVGNQMNQETIAEKSAPKIYVTQPSQKQQSTNFPRQKVTYEEVIAMYDFLTEQEARKFAYMLNRDNHLSDTEIAIKLSFPYKKAQKINQLGIGK